MATGDTIEIPRMLPDPERVAQLIAHRVCCGTEHDPASGKLHGQCVVCGVPWPCAYAGDPPAPKVAVIGISHRDWAAAWDALRKNLVVLGYDPSVQDVLDDHDPRKKDG